MRILCEDCVYDKTIVCECCDTRIWIDDNVGNNYISLCQSCYDYHYTTCGQCDCFLNNDNDEIYYAEGDDDNETPYCYSCYNEYEKTSFLRSYSYKPSPLFHGESTRYFGVELEIDDGGKDEYNAKILCELANAYHNNIYIKEDASLDNGMEIVTYPMTLNYHIQKMPWKSLLERSLELDYVSHQTDTCGLHIHVNRTSFSDSISFQDECIARILYIVERFWQELLKFSRRTESQLKRWANRYGYKDSPAEILDTAKSSCIGRYTCVNLSNHDTIEFRIFKGTLKYNTLIATLQLVEEICNVAFSMSDEEVSDLGWCNFMEQISNSKYPELIAYLKERRLYINEPVTVFNGEE